jgi:hypothetical protein
MHVESGLDASDRHHLEVPAGLQQELFEVDEVVARHHPADAGGAQHLGDRRVMARRPEC